MLNSDSEDDMPVQNSSDESHFLTNDESQSDTPSNFTNENNQSSDSFSPNSPLLFPEGIQNSQLWKQPKIISEINLKLFGVKSMSKFSFYKQLRIYYQFSYSKDGKYFIFANEVVVYILKCIEGWLVKKLKYKRKPDKFLITSDSKYLIVVFRYEPAMDIDIYIFKVYGLEDLKRYFVKKRETHSEIDFEVKSKQLYAMYFDKNQQMTIEIFNVYNGQLINVIQPLIYNMMAFVNRLFVINEHVFLQNTSFYKNKDLQKFNSFLYQKNGKVLKKMNNYQFIQDLFGLDIVYLRNLHIFRFYNVMTGKLLKKIKAKINLYVLWNFDQIIPNINIIKLKNELLLQINFNNQDFYELQAQTVELKCFPFQRIRRYYYGLEQMNENRVFEIDENGVIKFYQF